MQRAPVFKFFEEGNSFTPEAGCFAVSDYRLQALPNLDAVLVVTNCQKNEHTAVVRLWPNAPLAEQLPGKCLNGGTFKALHGDHGNLGLCALVHLRAEILDLAVRFSVYDVGKVIDETIGL